MKNPGILESLKSRQMRYGGYASFITIAVIVGLILVNLVVQRIPARVDLTGNQLFSLSEQSRQVIADLKKPVTIYGLFETGREPAQLVEILKRYEQESDLIRVEYIDPDLNPAFGRRFAEKDQEVRAGSLIVVSGDSHRVIDYFDLYNLSYQNPENPSVQSVAYEQRVTGALLYVAAGYSPTVYELTGHGEATFIQLQIAELLVRDNYRIQALNLIQSERVPEDAAVLTIINPERDLSEGEADAIREYLDGGGRAIVILDFSLNTYPVLNGLLEPYGIKFETGIIVEQNQQRSTGQPFQLLPEKKNHPILEPLIENDLPVLVPYARAISETELKRRTVEVSPLLVSTSQSFFRTDLQSDSPRKIPSDRNGPLNVAVAVSEPDETGMKDRLRMVAVGDAEFLQPIFPYGTIPGNIDFFMNSLNWTTETEESITIRPKSLVRFPMRLTGLQAVIYAALTVVLIPLAALILGLVVWLKRRHL